MPIDEPLQTTGDLFAEFLNRTSKNIYFLPSFLIFELLLLSFLFFNQNDSSFFESLFDLVKLPLEFLYGYSSALTGIEEFHLIVTFICISLWILLFVIEDFVKIAINYPIQIVRILILETIIFSIIHSITNEQLIMKSLVLVFRLPFLVFSEISYSTITFTEKIHLTIFFIMILTLVLGQLFSLVTKSGSEYRKSIGLDD